MASPSATSPNTDDILGSHRFTAPGASSSPLAQAPNAASILGGAPIDASALHPLAGLVDNKELDYLLLEDDKLSSVAGGKTILPSRGWGDELCYGTGSTYLAGLGLGGAWGFWEGLRRPIAAPRNVSTAAPAPAAAAAAGAAPPAAGAAPAASAVGAQATAFAKEAAAQVTEGAKQAAGNAQAQAAARISGRLRWNNILNQVTRRGTAMGNSAGVLALIYNGINSTIDVYRGHQHDVYGSMTAAALTGLIWRSTAGVRPMVITSGLLTAAAAGWSWVKVQLL
ncbi:protein transporter TIM23 [Rhodotorula paludigena]|uniref:protein transporter TIM23 n=1 Tax=Rhodotorula paludigena TaxID=86838 RepID=UPI00316EFCD1